MKQYTHLCGIKVKADQLLKTEESYHWRHSDMISMSTEEGDNGTVPKFRKGEELIELNENEWVVEYPGEPAQIWKDNDFREAFKIKES